MKKESITKQLKDAQTRILILEGERAFLRKQGLEDRQYIIMLHNTIRPFKFTASPEAFQGSGVNMTPCMIKDTDVQAVRRLPI